MASIQIYLGEGEILSVTGRGTKLWPKGPKPQARRAKRPRSERQGSWGGGQRAPPHQLGDLEERFKLSHRGPGPKFEIWCNFRPQKSLHKCLIVCKSYPLYSAPLHLRATRHLPCVSHSVTCHPTQVNTPALTPARRRVLDLPSHYPSEMLRPLAHSSVASNHSILTHSSPNLNIRHLATARASDSSYLLDYVARYKFSYVCMHVQKG